MALDNSFITEFQEAIPSRQSLLKVKIKGMVLVSLLLNLNIFHSLY